MKTLNFLVMKDMTNNGATRYMALNRVKSKKENSKRWLYRWGKVAMSVLMISYEELTKDYITSTLQTLVRDDIPHHVLLYKGCVLYEIRNYFWSITFTSLQHSFFPTRLQHSFFPICHQKVSC